MNILVDTSMWSLALRRQSTATTPEATKLQDLITSGESIYLVGVILQELLQALRSKQQFVKLKQHLDVFPLLPLTRADYVYAAELATTCRHAGVQASTIDYLIAAAAIKHNTYLLTADKDFVRIAAVSPLKLL